MFMMISGHRAKTLIARLCIRESRTCDCQGGSAACRGAKEAAHAVGRTRRSDQARKGRQHSCAGVAEPGVDESQPLDLVNDAE